MTIAGNGRFGFHRQRGFWLRYFLGAAKLVALAIVSSLPVVHAQITIHKPLHVSRVQGIVANKSGEPISNAEITLLREGSLTLKSHTDESGQFKIGSAAGPLLLRVSASGYSPLARDLIVETTTDALSRTSQVYVMLGPAACSDECSLLFTNRKYFDRAVRLNTGHYY